MGDMEIIFIFTTVVLASASAWETEDYDCFNNTYPDITSKSNTTFEIRIEHAGDLLSVEDWFDNGEVLSIKAGEVIKKPTTSSSEGEVCSLYDDWCKKAKESLEKIVNQTRTLTIGFDGIDIYVGMKTLNITLTNNTDKYATSKWDKCKTQKQKASDDMEPLKLVYINWDITAMPDIPQEIFEPVDKFFVHAGVDSIVASCFTILGLLIISRIL